MNNEKTMTIKQLTRELDTRVMELRDERERAAVLMHEIILRLNKRELTYTSDRLTREKHTLFVSVWTQNDYPEMMARYELELHINYEDLYKDEYEDFENNFFPRLPDGWMVTRRGGDPACCSMSFYVARNREWVRHQESANN